MKPYVFDKTLKRWGLFLSDLPDENWIEYVRHLEGVVEAATRAEELLHNGRSAQAWTVLQDALEGTV